MYVVRSHYDEMSGTIVYLAALNTEPPIHKHCLFFTLPWSVIIVFRVTQDGSPLSENFKRYPDSTG